MNIFKKDKELFKPKYNHQYSINGISNIDNLNNSVSFEENIMKRCNIDNLKSIFIKNTLILNFLPLILAILLSFLLALDTNLFFIIIVLSLMFMIRIFIKNLFMKDRIVNDYINRKTEFYNIVYSKLSKNTNTLNDNFTQFRNYIDIFSKKYKMKTAYKEMFGIFLIFSVLILMVVINLLFEINHKLDENIIIYNFLASLIICVFIYIYFILLPLKRRDEIWYKINLFENKIVDLVQSIIPDNENKRNINYPVNNSLKRPFIIYLILSIFTGVGFIFWNYQIVMSKKVYLSTAYLVEDYLVSVLNS